LTVTLKRVVLLLNTAKSFRSHSPLNAWGSETVVSGGSNGVARLSVAGV